ncbi:Cytochrome P450 [Senna tora]|uniref:Cytochrome P450 n=1 Tax=Senna tora TaxID=362788 RepID=A0A835CEM5_9FABA|nr:Cytochrome P450 [Senna tora]
MVCFTHLIPNGTSFECSCRKKTAVAATRTSSQCFGQHLNKFSPAVDRRGFFHQVNIRSIHEVVVIGVALSVFFCICSSARGSSTLVNANEIPGHILLPDPKGMYSKLVPVKSRDVSWNLSGMKLSASYHSLGSLASAHALIMTLVFLGMIYPPMLQGSLHSLGSNKGAACAFSPTLGFLISSDIVHSITVAEVSVPALKMSWMNVGNIFS